MRVWAVLLGLVLTLGLTGCASRGQVADDGRPLDPNLLASFQLYGQGERALRPALERSAQLAASNKLECEKQWELPFAVATAAGSDGDDRAAWMRTLNVDDRLTVIASTETGPLAIGDRIVRVGRLNSDKSLELLEALGAAREAGEVFDVQLASGRRVPIKPFPVCRGYTRLAPPTAPKVQDYHWLMSIHPLELPQSAPTSDEVLWAVVWTQGLSEEGGARMKTYHYALKIGSTLFQIYSLASGLTIAAEAANTVMKEAGKKAASMAVDFAREQLIKQGKELAAQKIREGLQDAAGKITRGQAMAMLQASAANRGSLGGIGMIAATAWERADAWAFARMQELGADPLAGLRLHQKMVERELPGNAFALDADRLQALTQLAETQGMRGEVQALLRRQSLEGLGLEMAAMPMASKKAAFSFASTDDPAAGRYSRGLIDGMLQMPAQGARP